MSRGLAALTLALCAAGCAASPRSDVADFALNTGANSFEVLHRKTPHALVLPVIHDRQMEGPSCGAHALASVLKYWSGPDAMSGAALFQATPPASEAGYSMAELMSLARAQGLLAGAVRLSGASVIQELEHGRPVLVPVRLPSIYVQERGLPGGDIPVIGMARNALVHRTGRVAEWSHLAMVDHYLLVVGYERDTFVVVEPLMGYRTIRSGKLERYRAHFGDAALVFSAGAASGASVPHSSSELQRSSGNASASESGME